ncbi:MAG: phosphoribosylaminoimidazolesuccinocarboxamide synthase [Micavibrio sp.]|nr:phosphoribosylaminoimidazolesuccinocarboxamide synthase [Micavibrio sp.]
MLPEIIYEGSVKNVRGEKDKAPYIFEFSDRYSIFDWGQMPDMLTDKGASLAFMGWFFFDYLGKPETWQNWQAPDNVKNDAALVRLRAKGLSHHALGLVDHDSKQIPLEREYISPTRCLAVQPVTVLNPESSVVDGKLLWDYTPYKAQPENALVPLEVIFRFGVPEGSSLLQRTGDAAYCKAIGLDKAPKAGDTFTVPVVEFSTKLETSDRYLSYADAQGIASLNDDEFTALQQISRLVSLRLKDCFAEIGIELWDGKLEFAFGKRQADGMRDFMLVDSIGPDELRLIKDGQHLSKEALRGFYRPTSWYAAIETGKALAKERGEKDWKKICTDELKSVPPLLAPAVKQRVEMIYKGIATALSEKFCGGRVFADAWSLDDVVKQVQAKKQEVA